MNSRPDKKYMLRCLELAAKGLGNTLSNPLVGCVIVNNDLIIGEGYHKEFGGPHAEVIAIESVRDKSLLKNSTLYVNLEPCNHFGKTPPCTRKILENNIRHVIIGNADPNPEVRGKGIDFLIQNGITVESNFMEEECKFLNRRFFTFINTDRPYIILKWAQSGDGFIDSRKSPKDPGTRSIISGERSQILVHKWRSEEMAILVGTNTANMDNPSLTVRNWYGKQALRILLERNTSLNDNLKIFNDGINTLVYTCKQRKNLKNVEFVHIKSENFSLKTILEDLKKRGLVSLFVEGGSRLLNSFISQNLWDEARIFSGKSNLEKGLKAVTLNKKGEKYQIEEDLLEIIFN